MPFVVTHATEFGQDRVRGLGPDKWFRIAISPGKNSIDNRPLQVGDRAEDAAAICARFASIELVRFTNSGTEANLMPVSAARVIPGRPKIPEGDRQRQRLNAGARLHGLGCS